jgi:hypothetical protein
MNESPPQPQKKSADTPAGRLAEQRNVSGETSIRDATQAARDQLAEHVRGLRAERDAARTKSTSLPMRAKGLLGSKEPEQYAQTADRQARLAREALHFGKANIEEHESRAIQQVLDSTVLRPLHELSERSTWQEEGKLVAAIEALDRANLEHALQIGQIRSQILASWKEAVRRRLPSGSPFTRFAEMSAELLIEETARAGTLPKDCEFLLTEPNVLASLDGPARAAFVGVIESQPGLGAWVTEADFQTLDTLVSVGAQKVQEAVVGLIDEELKNDRFDLVQQIPNMPHFYTHLQPLLEVRLDSYCEEKFGLSFSADLKPYWTEGSGSGGEYDLGHALSVMVAVERSCPQGVKALAERYGIREFYRYPSDLLVAQLNEEDIQQPYGIIVYPRADYNGAFDSRNDRRIMENMFEETRGHHGLKLFEADGTVDLARILISLDRKYGRDNKIAFAVLAGHGSSYSIRFGDHHRRRDALYQTQLAEPGARRTKDFFVQHPTVIFFSCSTGEDQGIAQEISKQLEAQVIAPTQPTRPSDVAVSYSHAGEPHFTVEYSSDSRIYVQGEVTEEVRAA